MSVAKLSYSEIRKNKILVNLPIGLFLTVKESRFNCQKRIVHFSFTRKRLRIWNVRDRLDVPAGAFRALVKATLQDLRSAFFWNPRIRNTATKSQNNRHILVFPAEFAFINFSPVQILNFGINFLLKNGNF